MKYIHVEYCGTYILYNIFGNCLSQWIPRLWSWSSHMLKKWFWVTFLNNLIGYLAQFPRYLLKTITTTSLNLGYTCTSVAAYASVYQMWYIDIMHAILATWVITSFFTTAGLISMYFYFPGIRVDVDFNNGCQCIWYLCVQKILLHCLFFVPNNLFHLLFTAERTLASVVWKSSPVIKIVCRPPWCSIGKIQYNSNNSLLQICRKL